MLRQTFLLFMFLLSFLGLRAQETASDTTIYTIVQQAPLSPGCNNLDTTIAAKQACSQQALLEFVSQRILYPEEARQQNIQGTVVLDFVVEKDGTISNPKIVRDLGGNTGLAALSVLLAMQDANFRFIPARLDEKEVRYRYTLPVRFRLEEPKPYVLIDRDTVYTQLDQAPAFNGGSERLTAFIDSVLSYPPSGDSTCRRGQIDVKLQIGPDGRARVLDIVDYNDLGFDFWYEAIHASVATSGNWQPAVFEGREVPAALDLSLTFTSQDPGCSAGNAAYDAALATAAEGLEEFDAGNQEEGIAKMTAALEQFPDDSQLLMLRGQAYLDSNQLSEACSDLRRAREISLVDWFDSILPYICVVSKETTE